MTKQFDEKPCLHVFGVSRMCTSPQNRCYLIQGLRVPGTSRRPLLHTYLGMLSILISERLLARYLIALAFPSTKLSNVHA